MKHKLGTFLMILGCGLMAAALSLFFFNRQEQVEAGNASQEAIVKVVEAIQEQRMTEPAAETLPAVLPEERTMTVSEIDGYGYIGFVGIPALELELPVMADWSYPQLKIAPCRYTGTTFADDLVIMAHNYARHFGKLKDMQTGDVVTFTDMDGETVTYEVAALDVLQPTAIEEMTAGEYDLTLFTCTYGGKSRVTVRCDRADD